MPRASSCSPMNTSPARSRSRSSASLQSLCDAHRDLDAGLEHASDLDHSPDTTGSGDRDRGTRAARSARELRQHLLEACELARRRARPQLDPCCAGARRSRDSARRRRTSRRHRGAPRRSFGRRGRTRRSRTCPRQLHRVDRARKLRRADRESARDAAPSSNATGTKPRRLDRLEQQMSEIEDRAPDRRGPRADADGRRGWIENSPIWREAHRHGAARSAERTSRIRAPARTPQRLADHDSWRRPRSPVSELRRSEICGSNSIPTETE